MIKIFADGLCEPVNPGGYACWAWVALDADGREIAKDSGCIGHGAGLTNNVAEYHAVLRALEWTAQHARGATVELFTDSKLVVNQVNADWWCNAAHLQPLRDRALELLSDTGAELRWIPREQNTWADALSRRAYCEARGLRWKEGDDEDHS